MRAEPIYFCKAIEAVSQSPFAGKNTQSIRYCDLLNTIFTDEEL